MIDENALGGSDKAMAKERKAQASLPSHQQCACGRPLRVSQGGTARSAFDDTS